MDIKNLLNIKNISFFFLIVFIIFCIVKMPDITLLIFASYVIYCAINPAVDKLSEKMPRPAAAFVIILAITAIIVGIFTPIIITAVKEIKDFVIQLPSQIQNIELYLNNMKIGGQNINQLFDLKAGLANSTQIAQEIVDKSINFTVGVFGGLTILVTLAIIVFFMVNDKEKIKEVILKLFPAQTRKNVEKVIKDLESKVGGYVTAQLLCIIQVGVVVTAGLLILRVNYAVFLGFISAVLDLIPVVGPILAGIIILLVTFSKGPVICALAVGVLLLAQIIENNWSRPYFFSKYLDLHPLIVIFSFIFAAKLLGVVGVVLAPAIAAVLVTLFEEIYIKTMNDE
jgi:predicted PurR-regulated permease PerM